MKILALNPPFLPRFSREQRSPAVTKSGTLYYPMWLCYAVGYLEKQGHEVVLIDAPAQGVSSEEVIRRVQAFVPDMAVIATSTPSIYEDIATAAALKNALPALFTILVGVHVSALPRETLGDAPAVDAVAVGEYDATLVECAAHLQAGGARQDLSSIRGVAYRDRAGEIRITEPRPLIEDLDDIPPVSQVYRRHLDIAPYFYGHSRYPLVVLVTGRGCPFHCTYCVIPQTMHGHRYRKRSIDSIVAEFRYIAAEFPHVKEIMVEDDTLTADRQRCRDFAQALITAGATTIPWSANSRADVDFETMQLMHRANCRLFCVGFESGKQEILDNIKKGTKIPRIHQFMKDARRSGILIHGCFMVGNRGETRQTLETTLAFAKQLNPDTAQFYPIMVYPGTEDYTYFREKGWIVSQNFRDWLTADGLHSSVVSNPDLPYEFLVEFCDRARREFYLRPAYILGKLVQVVRHPSEIRRLIKGGWHLIHYLFHKPQIRRDSASSTMSKGA